MSTLLLHLPLLRAGAETEYRYTLSADGHSASGQGSARVALLPAGGRGAGGLVGGVPARAPAPGAADAHGACALIKARGGKVIREAGPMKHGTTVIAFAEDPDGYKIELIQFGTL